MLAKEQFEETERITRMIIALPEGALLLAWTASIYSTCDDNQSSVFSVSCTKEQVLVYNQSILN